MSASDYMTLKEVATLLQCSQSTVFRWVQRGRLTPLRMDNRGHIRFKRTQVIAAIEKSQSEQHDRDQHDPSMG